MWTSIAQFKPSRNAMKVEAMVTSSPSNITFILTICIFISITFNAGFQIDAKKNKNVRN